MISIREALAQGCEKLQWFDSARIDAEILLAYAVFKNRAYLYTYPEQHLTAAQWQNYCALIQQRGQGRPVAYLTGTKEFWSMPLTVNEHTLIPRPETELLVELCLQLNAKQRNARILDLGTGSGAIALSLAKERPDWQIYACDRSKEALQIAQENADKLQLSNITFFHSDWFTELSDPQFFHAIVSNPPYIAAEDVHLQKGDLRFEPQSALVSGQDGLKDLQHIIQYSLARLESHGLLLIEHGYNQKSAVGSMLKDYGYQNIQCWKDWQDNDRVSVGFRISS